MVSPVEANFVGPKTSTQDLLDLFNPEDIIHAIQPTDTTLAHLMFRGGFFSSISEARRNGWNKPIEHGWNMYKIGKKNKDHARNILFVWNPKWTLEEFEKEFPE